MRGRRFAGGWVLGLVVHACVGCASGGHPANAPVVAAAPAERPDAAGTSATPPSATTAATADEVAREPEPAPAPAEGSRPAGAQAAEPAVVASRPTPPAVKPPTKKGPLPKGFQCPPKPPLYDKSDGHRKVHSSCLY